MCTVTVIPLPAAGGFRLACNRDESRRRAPARPPIEVRFARAWAVMPIDSDRGGTWVAVSDRGLVFAVLNYNPQASIGVPPAPQTRGAIVPALLDCPDVAAVVDHVTNIDPAAFGPFRLLVAGGGRYAEVVSNRADVEARARDFTGTPILLTSSGLGDALVEPPRRELFNRTLAVIPTPAAQDEFHRHHWPERPHLSVCMSRPDARTVSYTTVEVSDGAAAMSYWPVPPDEAPTAAPVVRRVKLVAPPREAARPR
jgi:hypothetical protein